MTCALISFIFEIKAKKVQSIFEETQTVKKENVENPQDGLNFYIGGEVIDRNETGMKTLDCNFLKELEESLEKTEDDSMGLTFTEIQ